MLVVIAGFSLIGAPLAAQTIYPIDRAAILAGARFDFKVEFPEIENQADLKITIDGEDYTRQLGKAGQFVENEDGLRCLAKYGKCVYDNHGWQTPSLSQDGPL